MLSFDYMNRDLKGTTEDSWNKIMIIGVIMINLHVWVNCPKIRICLLIFINTALVFTSPKILAFLIQILKLNYPYYKQWYKSFPQFMC
jgi:hypothetical protein